MNAPCHEPPDGRLDSACKMAPGRTETKLPADTTSHGAPAASPVARGTGDAPPLPGAALHGAALSEAEAERLIGAICFKTGPPGRIGAELEWLVSDRSDPSLPIPYDRIRGVLSSLAAPGCLPGGGALTVEPGGQVELSTAPAASVAECAAAASGDLAVLREAFGSAGLVLSGRGIDPLRPPVRVLDLPRYAAMERYFDRRGPWGRLMMCSTASVQVCVEAGLDDGTASGYRFRWRLLHALGPVLVAAFANSPLGSGRPTGWKCTRQLVWSRLDPCRTWAPPGAEPAPGERPAPGPGADPRRDWAGYAMEADVLCVRQPGGQPWAVPAGLTFRGWLRGPGADALAAAGLEGLPAPTADDLRYHLSTLFPPVRARGHLELRMIDAQPGDGWVVPLSLVGALTSDTVAADAALAAAEPVWHRERSGQAGPAGPWLRAARHGPADPELGRAVRACFEVADAALARSHAPPHLRAAVADFADRYASRGRCPADDVLDHMPDHTAEGPS